MGERLARNRSRPRGQGVEDDEPRRFLAVGRATWCTGSPVPRHRSVRRRHGGDHVNREHARRVPDVPHRERRPDLDADLPEHRADRLLRLHGVLRQAPGSRALGSDQRALPDPGHERRRAQLADRRRRHAAGTARRVRVRRQRAVPHRCWWTGCVVRDGWGRSRAGLPLERPRTHLDSREHTDSERSERRDLSACLPGSASRDRSRQRLCPRRRLGGHACAYERRRSDVAAEPGYAGRAPVRRPLGHR